MSGDQVTYLDSSAIVRLVRTETGSADLRQFLRRRRPWVSSALATAEVLRAAATAGPSVVSRAEAVLSQMKLIRITPRLLESAGRLVPGSLRTLDAIHLATAGLLIDDLACLITSDLRVADAARAFGWRVAAPGT